MDRWRRTVSNEKGVALPLALFALVMLSGLLLTFLSMAGMEPTIAANLGDVTRARYAADAGIEWAFDQLVLNSNWNQLLATDGGKMATKMTLPGLTATAGTFSVTLRNDDQPGDTAITGLTACNAQGATDCGPAIPTNTNDNNQIVIVTATGNMPNGTSRQIQLVVSRIPLNIPGAINLPGVATKVDLPGNMEIYGLDTNPGSTNEGDGTCPAKYGMAVSSGNEADVESRIRDARQLGRINGLPQDPSKPGKGDNTIAADPLLTSQQVTDFVNVVKGKANVSLTSTPAAPLAYGDGVIGSTCAANWNSPLCWGTPAQPKIVYINAQTPNPTSPFNPASVFAENPTGAGILIVENGTLFLKGVSGWQGIIIVTGKNVGFDICCGRIHEVWGAIIVNETDTGDPPTNYEFTGGQHTDIYYSCQAIRNALSSRVTTRVTSWREF